jgi:hypothetical protein
VFPEDMLERIAATLRQDIGPAVAEPFAKTQAFMAAVILEKLARQWRAQAAGVEADAVETRALVADLRALLPGPPVPAAVGQALADVAAGADGGLGRLVAALYSARDELGANRFDETLARVRLTLRARLDRQLAYAS